MTDLFTDLKKKYKYHVPAAALIFSSPLVGKALRVEAPDIGKEFTDGANIGTDPEGFLYYNYLASFDKAPIKYLISKLINSDGKTCAHIRFYSDDPQETHAEFLAEDPSGAVTAADMDGYSSDGNWNDLKIGSTTASITKRDDQEHIKCTFDTIHMSATITIGYETLYGILFNVSGNFFFKDINKIKDGVFASYNEDRVVFYSDNNYGTDFTGYFIPFEYSPDKLGISSANTTVFKVSWD